jgi:hypothetical protein
MKNRNASRDRLGPWSPRCKTRLCANFSNLSTCSRRLSLLTPVVGRRWCRGGGVLELPLVDVEARCVAPDVAPPLRQEAGVHELPGAQVGDDVVAKAVRQGAQPVTRRGGVVLHGNGERPEAGGNGSDRRKIRLLLFWWYVIQIGTKRISAGPSRTCQASEPFTNRDQRTTPMVPVCLTNRDKVPICLHIPCYCPSVSHT